MMLHSSQQGQSGVDSTPREPGPKHDSHEQDCQETAAEICEDSLSRLVQSVLMAYADRPCIGLPRAEGQTVEWHWATFAEVMKTVYQFVFFLRLHRHRFAVISFECSCVELVAADLAAALLGMCSVVVAGPNQRLDILHLLGEDMCVVIDKRPESDAAIASDDDAWMGQDKDVLFTFFVTSGSTASPKLVRRTRATWLETVRDTAQFGSELCVTLSFASLAHSGPRTELWWNLVCGGQTAFAAAGLPLLCSWIALSPTEISAPPSVWSEIRRRLTLDGVEDPSSLRQLFPGLVRRLETVATGFANSDPDLLNFLRRIFGDEILVMDNYGATEVGSISVNGKISNEDTKIVEVPELGIYAPRGEICVKAEGAFEGYYDNAQTAGALTDDGFYRTGDIGEMQHGMLKVVGRLTNWVKLANGKFESLEAVEDELSQTSDFEQVCAVEISGSLAAVVYSARWDQNPSAAPSTSVPCVRAKEKFTVENGLLTPSLKLRRPAIRAMYEQELLQQINEKQLALSRWLHAVTGSTADVDETQPLKELGVTSVHFARLAADLGVPVHAVAAAGTLRDLKALSQTDKLGVSAALADVTRFSSSCNVSASPVSRTWRKVLVTGATGHLGRHFMEILRAHGISAVPLSRSLGHDVAEPMFGMARETFDSMSDCDAVIHCAAIVNWTLSYGELRAANVVGARQVGAFCCGEVDGRRRALLVIGSGAAFDEAPAEASWLQECTSPYIVSKLAAEMILVRLCPWAVVVRPGLVVWHSKTGSYNTDDGPTRLARWMKSENLCWNTEDHGDWMDGMNVDKFCQAALKVFEHGAPETYSMTGNYGLATLLEHLLVACTMLPYSEWYAAVVRSQKSCDPLAAPLPHIEADQPPFASFGQDLSPKCRKVLGEQLAKELREVSGYAAFARALS
ncbi:car [Symbiodinium microadriaticum]|nr:car [Symbiodinium microadriaticum]